MRAARVFVRISRYLLILTALSLITMPITEHFWTWDRFLQGGRDFELESIVLLSFLCLVMVLSKGDRHCVGLLFSAWRRLADAFDDPVVRSGLLAGAYLNPQMVPPPGPGICASDLPLQM